MPGKRKVNYSARSAFWPCGDCRRSCTANSVQCDACNSWYHYHCQQLQLDDIEYLLKPEAAFTCKSCCQAEIGSYSAESSLLRLRMAVLRGHQSLKYAAHRELLLMPGLIVPETLPSLHSKPVDTVSVMYIQSLGLDIGTPVKVKADGNCLFNSISTLLFGNDNKATEIRVRTCIQMCTNSDKYVARPDAVNTLILSPSFEDACRDCATDNEWSSAWAIMAIADVIGLSIRTHYPPMYGTKHLAYQTLNTTYHPSNQEDDRTIAIMWTHTSWRVTGLWIPNHFVPITTTVSTENAFQPSCHSSPIPATRDNGVNQTNGPSWPTPVIVDDNSLNQTNGPSSPTPVIVDDNSLNQTNGPSSPTPSDSG